jgi:hypothetical protein
VVQVHPDPPGDIGGVAQLGEHLLCKQGVIGSIPFTSTSILDKKSKVSQAGLLLVFLTSWLFVL